MARKIWVLAVLATSLIIGDAAFAQGNNNRNNRRDNPPNQNDGEQSRLYDQLRQPNAQNHGQYQGQNRGQNNNYRDDERGAGPDHAFRRGGRLPNQYRSSQYVVDDWRGHGLRAPPRGYHWVQTGGDYVLVAIATGIILQLLLNN